MEIQKRDTEFVFPCRTGEILQDGQPLFTAVYKARDDLRRIFPQKKKPEIQIQLSKLDKFLLNIVGTYMYAPKDDFLIPLIDVQTQTKTCNDVLHEATIDDYWNVDGNCLNPRSV